VSNLVVGGASLSRLSLVKTSKFLEESRVLGITEIDSAPLYGVEEKLGQILSGSKEFLYNSKVGRPLKIPITCSKIEQQVEKTLHDLRIEQINILFIHSISIDILSDKILTLLEQLRSQGIIKFLGYSGDSADLRAVCSLEIFDKFMGTLNYLDLGNYETLSNLPENQIYLKRILANGVFRETSCISKVRSRGHRNPVIDKNSYVFRHKILTAQEKVNLEQAISFINTKFLSVKKVVGMGSIRHLRQTSAIASRNQMWGERQFADWLENWGEKQRNFQWSVIT